MKYITLIAYNLDMGVPYVRVSEIASHNIGTYYLLYINN